MVKTNSNAPPAKDLDKSKTVIVNVLMLVAAFLPDVQEFLVRMEWGTEQIAAAVILVNVALRIATKGPVGMRLAVLRQATRWLTGRNIK